MNSSTMNIELFNHELFSHELFTHELFNHELFNCELFNTRPLWAWNFHGDVKSKFDVCGWKISWGWNWNWKVRDWSVLLPSGKQNKPCHQWSWVCHNKKLPWFFHAKDFSHRLKFVEPFIKIKDKISIFHMLLIFYKAVVLSFFQKN